MKVRILGTLFVLAVLAALFVITQEPSDSAFPNSPVTPADDTGGLQPLKIN